MFKEDEFIRLKNTLSCAHCLTVHTHTRTAVHDVVDYYDCVCVLVERTSAKSIAIYEILRELFRSSLTQHKMLAQARTQNQGRNVFTRSP